MTLDNNEFNNEDNKEKLEKLDEKESWDQDIYEEDGSRTTRRTKTERRTWYVVSIIVILFLIVFVTTGAIIYSQMSGNLDKGQVTQPSKPVAVASSSTKESETKSTESSTESTEESSTMSSSSSSSSTSETFSDVEVPKNDPSTRGEVANNQTQSQNQNQAQTVGGESVAFGQGESSKSLYSIARSAGISLEQIYQLNPGIDPNNIQQGQQIRVK